MMDYTYGDKSPSPEFLFILWILLLEQENKWFVLHIWGRQSCLILKNQDWLFFFLALSLASEYDPRKVISFAMKFPYHEDEDNNWYLTRWWNETLIFKKSFKLFVDLDLNKAIACNTKFAF